MVKSIRWTLQLWHAGLLAVVLASFGIASYYGVSRSRYNQIDGELSELAQIVASGVHMPGRGPPPHGPNSPGPPGDFRGRSPRGGRGGGPFDRGGPPRGRDGGRQSGPDNGEAGQPDNGFQADTPQEAQGGRGGFIPDGSHPPDAPIDFSQPNLQLSPAVASRFADGNRGSLYYAVFASDGHLFWKSASYPGNVPDPGSPANRSAQQGPGPSQIRQRDDLREAYTHAPANVRVVVGKSVMPEQLELRHLAWLLGGSGAGVLLIGLTGGWLLSMRIVRPIQSITSAAQEISATSLSRRINLAGTQSELGTLARVLNETFARLEAAFAQQVRFTADASHELRTPLAVIHTHAQLALSRERSAEEYRKMFQTCLRASDRMKDLVDSLLLLARADAGRLTINRAPIDLRDIAQECVDLLEPLAAKSGLTIQCDLQPASLEADAPRLAQVVTNLLTNAIRYNREGGQIQVRVRGTESAAVLAITDSGVGISPEHQQSLFQRFYRVDGARSRQDGGSGLGLAICKSIAEAHGGTIACQSEVDKGTTFTVTLPKASSTVG